MHYDFTAIPDADVPQAVELTFQHVLDAYASETNKTASVRRAVPDCLLDFKPHEKTNPIRTILVHQLLSERRFFAQFALQMTQHDIRAGLYAPLRVLLYEDERGRTWLEYDRPSSLFGQFANDRIAPTAAMLDRKLEALVAEAVG
jgi:hypothetical protein